MLTNCTQTQLFCLVYCSQRSTEDHIGLHLISIVCVKNCWQNWNRNINIDLTDRKKEKKHEHMNRRKTENVISKNINTNNYIYIKLSEFCVFVILLLYRKITNEQHETRNNTWGHRDISCPKS